MTTDLLTPIAEWSALITEVIGVLLIVCLALYFLVRGAITLVRTRDAKKAYTHARQNIARSILLGLELLVAADIIHTVAVELSYESVTILAIIVAIRTFLSFSLELETTGRWPWQQPDKQDE